MGWISYSQVLLFDSVNKVAPPELIKVDMSL